MLQYVVTTNETDNRPARFNPDQMREECRGPVTRKIGEMVCRSKDEAKAIASILNSQFDRTNDGYRFCRKAEAMAKVMTPKGSVYLTDDQMADIAAAYLDVDSVKLAAE